MKARLLRCTAFAGVVLLLAACAGGDEGDDRGNGDETADVGLDSRPSNASCLAGPAPLLDVAIDLQVAFPSLPVFTQPVGLVQEPPGPNSGERWFVLQQGGSVRVFDDDPNVTTHVEYASIDINATVSGNAEFGLLGMAFHPEYSNNGEVFLSFTEGVNPGMVSYVARFTDSDLNDSALPTGTRENLITLAQPASNHNGGDIAFGPDGYLYIGFGDGGGSNDGFGNGQDTSTLHGALLRIDVDSGAPYAIPADNPFASSSGCNDAGCREIYAWGLRNPWRWSFDRDTGELWLGDVGQNAYEEINLVESGGNYGWPHREGAHSGPGGGDARGMLDPVAETVHANGAVAVTGGFVYRGSAVPGLRGRYLFADHGNGRIWGIRYDEQGNALSETDNLLLDTGFSISSFGQGNDGELYVVDRAGGVIYRVVDDGSTHVNPPPERLSRTGCVNAAAPSEPASGLIPYDINVAFWSDNALKERFMALPDGESIDIEADGDWSFPVGTVLLKHFRIGGELVETRLLKHHDDGSWAGYSYEWNDAGTDATLVVGGKSKAVGAQFWRYPSGADCRRCHTQAAGRSLGPTTAQMNRAFDYAATGRRAWQLTTLNSIGLFSTPLAGGNDDHARLPVPDDADAPLADRARAYLDANCAQCHQPGGPAPVNIDFRYETAFDDTRLCDVVPQRGDVGITDARRLAPGDPARSELLARMSRRDAVGMPPLSSNEADTLGVALVFDWIETIAACP